MESYISFSFTENNSNNDGCSSLFSRMPMNENTYSEFYNNNYDSKFDIFNDNINKIQEFYINDTNMNRNFSVNSLQFSNENNKKYYGKNKFFIKKYNVYIKKNNNDNNISECPVCYNNIYPLNHKILDCKHFLCKYCYEKWNEKCCENNIKISCPLCRLCKK
jgi:hypothetical protein